MATGAIVTVAIMPPTATSEMPAPAMLLPRAEDPATANAENAAVATTCTPSIFASSGFELAI